MFAVTEQTSYSYKPNKKCIMYNIIDVGDEYDYLLCPYFKNERNTCIIDKYIKHKTWFSFIEITICKNNRSMRNLSSEGVKTKKNNYIIFYNHTLRSHSPLWII